MADVLSPEERKTVDPILEGSGVETQWDGIPRGEVESVQYRLIAEGLGRSRMGSRKENLA